MKTTIDIPEALYRKVKIRAAERGKTLKSLVLESLTHELDKPSVVAEARAPYWSNRKLVPEYEAAIAANAFSSGPDFTQVVSDERDGR